MKQEKVSVPDLDEYKEHQKNSEDHFQHARERYQDYESMLIGEHRESDQNENKVFDPRISTIEIERTARVASQRPSGKAFAVSENDQGKNMIMNLLLNFQMDNANEQYDFVTKQMMWSLLSRVYGVYYALTPWRITPNYIGNELTLVSIYDAFPQPNVSVQDAEWFIVGNRLSVEWLLAQDKDVWNMGEIKALKAELKGTEGDVKQQNNSSSYLQQTQFSTQRGDTAFPKIQTYTEYRGDKWVTWAPRVNTKKGREYLLRTVKNEDLEGMLPVVAKYALPMMGGDHTYPVGLGPFQRGKSLQFATNSLINMYLTTVREKLRPQLMINPKTTVMSSIKYDPGAYWFMQNPGQDVQAFQKGSDPDNTFNSAYGMMISAMLNQAGTTDTANSSNVESSLGKTPAAIKQQAASQGAQDYWEQTMLESAMGQVMNRWVMNNVKNLDTKQAIRVFGDEIERIAEYYPDALEMFSEKSGRIMVDNSMFQDGKEPIHFDYKIQTGSTAKPSLEKEVEELMQFIDIIDERPNFIAKMQQEGNDINATQLLREIMIKRGIREDKIIVQSQPQEMAPEEMPGQVPQDSGMPMEVPVEVPQMQPIPQYEDPDINAVAQELLGGQQGIPV